MTTEDKNKLYNSGDFKSLTDAQRRIFRGVVDELDGRQLLRVTDAPVIASYARNVTLARAASKAIEKYGAIIEVVDKYHGTRMAENPAVGTLGKAQCAMESTAIKLGLTPTGRKRLKDSEKPMTASDEWDEQED